MKQKIKNYVKNAFGLIKPSIYQKLQSLSLINHEFKELLQKETFKTREQLWDKVLREFEKKQITFVEFGVFEGYSIKYFVDRNHNENSLFIGLDTFTGLPENWVGTKKKIGHFDTLGEIPKISDKRVNFIKGVFQKTFQELVMQIKKRKNLVVHFDADLYSSTLFTLSKLDDLKIPYFAIFDEFFDHESRALSNYISAYCAEVDFLGKTTSNNYPDQVLCFIKPQKF